MFVVCLNTDLWSFKLIAPNYICWQSHIQFDRTIEPSGAIVMVIIIRSTMLPADQNSSFPSLSQTACEIAEQRRVSWGCDIVLATISDDQQFCASSAGPPAGIHGEQSRYLRSVAEDAMAMGLLEHAQSFALLRIHSLLVKNDEADKAAVRRPTRREMMQVKRPAERSLSGYYSPLVPAQNSAPPPAHPAPLPAQISLPPARLCRSLLWCV